MGHGDEIAIVDGNYPADAHARRWCGWTATTPSPSRAPSLSVMPLDDMVPAAAFRPGIAGQPDRREPIFADFEAVVERFEPGQKVHALQGDAFYDRVRGAYAIVATTEARLYGNLVLRKGVIRPG